MMPSVVADHRPAATRTLLAILYFFGSTAGLDTSGLKEQLVDRLFECFTANPSKSLEELSNSDDDLKAEEPLTIAELADQLKLSQATVDALTKEAFTTVKDLELFKAQNAGTAMADTVKGTCDRLELSAFLFPVSGTAKALPP
ncbi:hypothetical protein RvY_13727 [Ramazzottius varieornatus]|uniref:Uncharacterized protein n=1 Tax=Ramazzottius varieornatus TaxID=947166 RepID=A0A1D1VNV9_RAMVA|nr:hypothetical protein RvY_13727 [Ramazzottius varieornatus]